MSTDLVTVAVPVRNGGSLFEEVMKAICSQRLDRPFEVLVADSGSTDGSRALAEAASARIIDVPPKDFSHGGTRNRLAREARGTHVAFLTQDSVPADERWLGHLLDGFALAEDVALVFGPYRARPDASLPVRRELDSFFSDFSPDGRARVDRAESPDEGSGLGRRSYFTDANGCVARAAWKRVPFRQVPYAEDQVLAGDLLAAGYSKVYHPAAAVIHSHDYPPATLFRRCFDEGRALREVHGHVAPVGPIRVGLAVQRAVRDDVELMLHEEASRSGLLLGAAGSLRHHVMRASGAALGSRADRLPDWLRRRCSLEGRGGFGAIPSRAQTSGQPR